MKSVYCIIHTEYDDGQTYDDVLEECFLTAEQAKAFALKASEVAFDTDYEDCPYTTECYITEDGMYIEIRDDWTHEPFESWTIYKLGIVDETNSDSDSSFREEETK